MALSDNLLQVHGIDSDSDLLNYILTDNIMYMLTYDHHESSHVYTAN